MKQDKSLSIIIVVYYNAADVHHCIASLYNNLPASFFELIVVSNGFHEKDKTDLLHRFPAVQWIDMPVNEGFARANNAGIKAATGKMLLLLNPDTLALDDSVQQCYHRLLASGNAAAGVQLLNAAHEPQISGSHFVKGGLNHLLPIPYWGGFIRWVGYRVKTNVPGVQQAKAIEEVDWISGAFLMVKNEVVKRAGLLDEDFFLYAEEVEWCSRLKQVGRLVIYGDLKIVHLEGTSINQSQNLQEKGYYNLYDKKGLQLMVSNHLRVRKQYGVGWFLFLLLNYTFGVFVFWIAGTIARLFTRKHPFGHWGKAGAFAKNVCTLWTLAPKMIRNRPYFYKMF